MEFRDRLVATIRAAQPVLELPDILVVGSEVPNLLQPDAAATLVVSLDLGVPVHRHAEVKRHLPALTSFAPSSEEPSVLVPMSPDLLELNFVGIDSAQPLDHTYVLSDDQLPMIVFGPLSLVRAGLEIWAGPTRACPPNCVTSCGRI